MLGDIAEGHGISHWGVAPAQVLGRARRELERRKAAGLHDTMQFTYKNPQRSTDPQSAVAGARAVFVAALPYDAADPPDRPDALRGKIAKYAWADYYGQLRAGLWAVAERLRADGFKAVPFADDNSLVDREVAHRAGLGWFGKNANLLLRGAGSWFVLGSVVTTAPLAVRDAALVEDGCGACVRCIDACPTQAIVAPGVIDASRCLSWVLQRPGEIPEHLRTAVADRLYGCDDCQEACPPTVVFGRRFRPGDAGSGGDSELVATLPLLELLEADDAEVLTAWGRWYLAERDPRWVRRNALIALGNVLSGATGVHVDEPTRGRATDVLQRYGASIDPVLASHARWAVSRAQARVGQR